MGDLRQLGRQPILWTSLGALALGLIIVGLLIILRPHSPVDESIKKQLNFSVFYPDGSEGYRVDPDRISYDAVSKVLIFHARRDGQDLTISQQATPESFDDIPEYYPKLIEKLHGYSDFDSLNGKVSLTRPEELKGGQSAVFNSKGTLMFVHPSQDLSNDEWRRFFNALVIDK